MTLETNTTTVTGWINSSLISNVGLNYAIDSIMLLQRQRMEKVLPGT